MNAAEVETFTRRLQGLERRLRVVMISWMLTLIAVIALGIATRQAASQPQIVRARAFEVTDAAGRTRIVLHLEANGLTGMRVFDAAGRRRVGIDVFPDGRPWMDLHDATGKIVWSAP